MKGYFKYTTHDDPSRNFWYVLGEKGASEKEGEAISPWNGEEALLRRFIPFSESCIIIIRTGLDGGGYFLILEDPSMGDQIMTHHKYEWEEIVNHAALFKGQSFKAAQRILKSKKL